MRTETFRASAQTRPVLPEGLDGAPHPRAVALADAMLDIAALGHGGATFKDLIGAGFTSAEIIEHGEAAQKIANEKGTRQVAPSPDRLADMIEKARAAVPYRLPLPEGVGETQALFLSWGRYCAARAAFLIDPWPGQRERCIEVLFAYLDRLPLFPRDRKKIAMRVSATLQKVAQ